MFTLGLFRQPMRILIILIFFLSIGKVLAEPSNEVEFKKQLDVMAVDYASTPKQQLEQLEALILLAEAEDWRHSEIRAQVYKAELLLALEQIQSAQQIVDLYFPRTTAAHLLESRTRFQLIQLTINTIQNKPVSSLINDIEENLLLIEDEKVVAGIINALGINAYNNRKTEQALNYFKKSQALYEKLGDEVGLSSTLNGLANIFSQRAEYDIAIKYLEEVRQISIKSNDKYSESVTLFNLAGNYIAKNDYAKAQETLTQTLALNREIDDLAGVAWTNQAFGELFEKQKNFEKALLYYEQALAFFKENNDKNNIVSTSIGKINCLIELEKSDEVNQELLALKPIIDEYADDRWDVSYTRMEAKLAALQKDFKVAYELQVDVTKQYIEQFEKQNNKQIQELLVAYDSQKKETDNRILQQENELQELRLKQEQKETTIWRLALAFSVVLMLIIGYLLRRILVNKNHFQEMALKDHLTGSPNRRAILEFAERQFQISKRNRSPLTIAIIDVDFFKAINDNFGHDVGDDVLKAFSTALSSSIRNQDRFGRYGGEEWLLVLTNTTVDDVKLIFDRVTKNLNAIELSNIPSDYKITFSLGATQVDIKDANLNKAINRADENLYKAKETGRNKAVF